MRMEATPCHLIFIRLCIHWVHLLLPQPPSLLRLSLLSFYYTGATDAGSLYQSVYVYLSSSQGSQSSKQHVVGWRDDTGNAGCSRATFGSSVFSLSFPFLTGSIIWPPPPPPFCWTIERAPDKLRSRGSWMVALVILAITKGLFSFPYDFPFAHCLDGLFQRSLIYKAFNFFLRCSNPKK